MRQDTDHRDHMILVLSTDWLAEFLSATKLMPNERMASDVKKVARSIVSQMFGRATNYFEIDLSDKRRKRSYGNFLRGAGEAISKQEADCLNRLVTMLLGAAPLSKDAYWAIKNLFLVEEEAVLAGVDPLLAQRAKELVGQVDTMFEKSLAFASKWDEDLSRMFSGNTHFLRDFVETTLLPRIFFGRFAESVDSLGLSSEKNSQLARSVAAGVNWLGIDVPVETIGNALSKPLDS